MTQELYTTVCAYVPVEIIQRLDKKVEEMQVTRSNMIRRILKEYVENLEVQEDGQKDS